MFILDDFRVPRKNGLQYRKGSTGRVPASEATISIRALLLSLLAEKGIFMILNSAGVTL